MNLKSEMEIFVSAIPPFLRYVMTAASGRLLSLPARIHLLLS